MLKILGLLVVLLLVTILLIVVIGYSLPKDHVAARAISLRRQPADVFALISNFKDEPSWRADVQQVEMLPERDGIGGSLKRVRMAHCLLKSRSPLRRLGW